MDTRTIVALSAVGIGACGDAGGEPVAAEPAWRVERDGVLVDAVDHVPSFLVSSCPQFRFGAVVEGSVPP